MFSGHGSVPATFSGCSIRFSLALALYLLFGLAAAQTYFALPGYASVRDGTITFDYGGTRYAYTPGLGWTGLESSLNAPRLEDGRLYVQSDVLTALGVKLPQLLGVRSSGGGTVRLVLDFAGLEPGALEELRGEGVFSPARPLELMLPRSLLPLGLSDTPEGLTLKVQDSGDTTRLTLSGPGGRYEVFPLAEPTRLVIDLQSTPGVTLSPPEARARTQTDMQAETQADAQIDAREELLSRLSGPRQEARVIAPGVTLRAFTMPTLAGSSQVDLVEIAPGFGRFDVAGGSYNLRPASELTGTALVGINASYFDPGGGRSIGLLKQRGVLESLPSRNRAAVGFGFGTPLIERLGAQLELRVNGRQEARLSLLSERVTLHTEAGSLVGSPRQGAIVVAPSGQVMDNKVGPRRVPVGGFVLSYQPDVRKLALVNAGDALEFRLTTRPDAWRFVPEAVEAGPLLVTGSQSAYRPGLEAFDTADTESNINRRTTRAALGVRRDGTVLLLVATQLTTAELVPLFLQLRAEAALQLDSGGSSTLVVGGDVINRPALAQRRVATVIRYTPNLNAAGSAGAGVAQDETR